MINLDGFIVKELRCKNDDCRKLIGYDNITVGVFIYDCKCGVRSVFRMSYPKGQQAMDYLKTFNNPESLQEKPVSINLTTEGGEK